MIEIMLRGMMATTLLQLKMRKSELRNKMNADVASGGMPDDEVLGEYRTVTEQLENAESLILRPLSE